MGAEYVSTAWLCLASGAASLNVRSLRVLAKGTLITRFKMAPHQRLKFSGVYFLINPQQVVQELDRFQISNSSVVKQEINE